MEPIKFPEVTHTLAENQPEYTPLPVHLKKHSDNVTNTYTACFKLTPEEIEKIKETGEIWYQQINFGIRLFAPMIICVDKPDFND